MRELRENRRFLFRQAQRQRLNLDFSILAAISGPLTLSNLLIFRGIEILTANGVGV